MKKTIMISGILLLTAAVILAAGCVDNAQTNPIVGVWQYSDEVGNDEMKFNADGTGVLSESVLTNTKIIETSNETGKAFKRINTWDIKWTKTGDNVYSVEMEDEDGEITFNSDGTGTYTVKLTNSTWDFIWELIEENSYRLYYPETNTLEEITFSDNGIGIYTSSTGYEYWNYIWEETGDNQYSLKYPDNTEEVFTFNEDGTGTSVYTKNGIPETWELTWKKPTETAYIVEYSDGENHILSFKDEKNGILRLITYIEPVTRKENSYTFTWTDNGNGNYRIAYDSNIEETGTLDADGKVFKLTDAINGIVYTFTKK